MYPSETAIRHSATERKTCIPAESQYPSLAKINVCRLKAEKVVAPEDANNKKVSYI